MVAPPGYGHFDVAIIRLCYLRSVLLWSVTILSVLFARVSARITVYMAPVRPLHLSFRRLGFFMSII
jgi:hypothetical protein